jgi:hypothetical protein
MKTHGSQAWNKIIWNVYLVSSVFVTKAKQDPVIEA